jgi:hypothetical protein
MNPKRIQAYRHRVRDSVSYQLCDVLVELDVDDTVAEAEVRWLAVRRWLSCLAVWQTGEYALARVHPGRVHPPGGAGELLGAYWKSHRLLDFYLFAMAA